MRKPRKGPSSRQTVSAPQKRRLFRDLDRADDRFIKRIEVFLDFLYRRYFRVTVAGWENVPPERVLFVGNHNGMITFEVLMLFYAWYQRYGLTRRAVGLAHGIALDNPLFRWLCPRIGAVPADPEVAREALARDFSVLVYPGGEKEAFRSFMERKKVDFYGRKGFLRLALAARAKVVPIASVGAHEAYWILWRGEWLADKLGLKKRYRLHGVPITFRFLVLLSFLAVGGPALFPLLFAPAMFAWALTPLPTQMSFHILPAIDLQALIDPSRSEDENLDHLYQIVTGVLQDEVLRMYRERKVPVLG